MTRGLSRAPETMGENEFVVFFSLFFISSLHRVLSVGRHQSVWPFENFYFLYFFSRLIFSTQIAAAARAMRRAQNNKQLLSSSDLVRTSVVAADDDARIYNNKSISSNGPPTDRRAGVRAGQVFGQRSSKSERDPHIITVGTFMKRKRKKTKK